MNNSKELYYLQDVLERDILSGYKATEEGLNGGKYVQILEGQFRDYFKVKHALAFSSGTSALFCAVKACELKSIVTTPITFSATASSAIWAGCDVKFSDIDLNTYNMKETSGNVLSVDLMGNPNPIPCVIEDACQALGAEAEGRKAGTFGHVGCFSFNQGKIISCGEGGMAITNDDKLAHRMKMLRNHGECYGDILGFNFRMTELQAAVASARFDRLDETVDYIRKLAHRLTYILSDVKGVTPPLEVGKHTFNYYALRCKDRDGLQNKLKDKGIYFGKGGYLPLYKLPVYKSEPLPNAETMYKEVMFTNILRPPMTLGEVERIGKEIRRCV